MIKNRDWLKKMRLKKGLTQKELAKKIGISIHTIANIEQGQRKGSPATWEKILNFFEKEELKNDIKRH